MSIACLDTLVGLSKTPRDCFTDAVPDDFDTSDSGFYLTDTDYGLTVIDQCETAGWTLLQAAKEQAILEFKADLRAKLRERYAGAITPFSGLIGQLKSTGTVSVSPAKIGHRFRMKRQKGASLFLKKVYVGINTSGTYTLKVRSNDPLFVPVDVSLTVTANALTTAHVLATEIELPCWSRSCQDTYLEYYASIDRGAALPLNNTLTCCGNKQAWANHVDVSGFMAADETAETNASFSSNAYGIAFDAYLQCAELDWICELEELNGYPILQVIARAIQFRGAAIAIAALIETLQVTPCTGYQMETLNSQRAYLNKRYADNIAWIAANLPDGLTDCFACKPEAIFQRNKILV